MKDLEEEKKQDKREEDSRPAAQASDYNFIREKIKDRPINKKKLFRRTFLTAGMAVLFGLIACVTFLLLEPQLGKLINRSSDSELKVITLPEQTEEEENIKAVIVPAEDEEPEQIVIETPIEDMILDDDASVSTNEAEESVSEDRPVEELPPEEVKEPEPQIVYEQIPLELEDYRLLYRKMYALSREVSRSLVTVTSSRRDMDWLGETDETLEQTIGLIVADNGYELLIVVNAGDMDGGETIRATFCDGKKAELYKKAEDKDTGLAIYAVRLLSLEQGTRDAIATATIGNSYPSNILGNAVMAVGMPLGEQSICYGAVTSAARTVSARDACYQLLTTDIYGSSNASGVLVNVRGQIAGIICQKYNEEGRENMIYAYGISGIRKLIENMSNGKECAYLGLRVADIPEDTAEEYGIPEGVYVSRVEMDSPAMNAGIAKGDVIMRVGDSPVFSVNDYMTALQKCEPGEEITLTYARLASVEYRDIEVQIVPEIRK
ncbi:MAG: PDZ domain-containing protein [Lachnospiraceae bacterium]|nr:PDZ domain-containing protein [Lachnospiraceae bacterium]